MLTLDLLVLRHPRQQVASEQEVDSVHVFALLDSLFVQVNLQRAEPIEERPDQVIRRWLVRELLAQAVTQVVVRDRCWSHKRLKAVSITKSCAWLVCTYSGQSLSSSAPFSGPGS